MRSTSSTGTTARYLAGALGGRAARPAPAGDRVFHPARQPLGRDRDGAGRQARRPRPSRSFSAGWGRPTCGSTCSTHFPEIDYIVLGEGEESFPDADRSARTRGRRRRRPRSRAWRCAATDGRPARPPREAGLRPGCAAHAGAARSTSTHLSLTRGCVSNCAFCGSPAFWGRRVRSHSAAYFVEQLAMPARARPAVRPRERRHLHARPATRDRGLPRHRRPRPRHRLGGDLARGRGGRGGAGLDAPRGLHPDQLRGGERVGGDPPAAEQAASASPTCGAPSS